MRTLRATAVVLVALASGALAGCGTPARTLPGSVRGIGGGAAVPATSQAAAEAVAEESVGDLPSTVSTSAPAGLPARFPLPAGELVQSESTGDAEGRSYTISLTAPVAEGPAPAAAAYAEALRDAGWQVEPAFDDGTGVTVAFTRGGQAEQGAATFESPDGSALRISVTLTVTD